MHNERRPARTQHEADFRLLEAISGRMAAELAADCSDAEIARTLSPCVSGPRLIAAAKRLRDAGALESAVANLRPPPEDVAREDAAYAAGFEALKPAF